MKRELLSLQRIKKEYRGIQILTAINLDVFFCEIHSAEFDSSSEVKCLFDILSGNSFADAGKILLLGENHPLNLPVNGGRSPIWCLNTECISISSITVAEYLMLNDSGSYTLGFHMPKRQKARAIECLKKYGITHISVQNRVCDLALIDQYILQILRAIQYNKRLIIIKNISDWLSSHDLISFGKFMVRMKAMGISFLCMSSSPNSLILFADQRTQMSDGRTIRTFEESNDVLLSDKKENVNEILHLIRKSSKVLYSCKKLKLSQSEKDFSFDLHKGEILCISCADYKAATSLANQITGSAKNGEFIFSGKKVCLRGKYDALKRKIALIQPDYERTIFPNFSLKENISIVMERHVLYPFGLRSKRMENYAVHNALSILGEEQLYAQFKKEKLKETFSSYHQFVLSLARYIAANVSVFVLLNPQMSFSSSDIADLQRCIGVLRSNKCSVIIVTVNPELFFKICDRTVFLS